MLNMLLRRVDLPAASEIIGLEFDNFYRVMPEQGLVFGGAIRDIVAGGIPERDIDVMVDPTIAEEVVKRVAESAWWTRKNKAKMPSPRVALAYSKEGNHLQEQMNALYPRWRTHVVQGRSELFGMDGNGNKPMAAKKPYPTVGGGAPAIGGGYAKFGTGRPMIGNPYGENGVLSDKNTFINEDGRELQIVVAAKSFEKDPLISAMLAAKRVDLICCGFVMDIGGIVYETVDGAEEQAKEKVLRVNQELSHFDVPALTKRITGLVERGWKDEVDWDFVKDRNKAFHDAKKAKPRRAKKVSNPKCYLRYVPKKQELVVSFASKILPVQQQDHAKTFVQHLPGGLFPKRYKRGVGYQVVCTVPAAKMKDGKPSPEILEEFRHQAHMIANAVHLTIVDRTLGLDHPVGKAKPKPQMAPMAAKVAKKPQTAPRKWRPFGKESMHYAAPKEAYHATDNMKEYMMAEPADWALAEPMHVKAPDEMAKPLKGRVVTLTVDAAKGVPNFLEKAMKGDTAELEARIKKVAEAGGVTEKDNQIYVDLEALKNEDMLGLANEMLFEMKADFDGDMEAEEPDE
jgi:hypothetical protein